MAVASFEDVIAFHGHICAGLAVGYRMTAEALAPLEATRAEDEEIVAIIENRACGVDAVQVLSGCTFGKGNLVLYDFGKPVYTFFSRRTGRGVRVAWREGAVPERLANDRDARVAWILDAPAKEIVALRSVHVSPPDRAEIRQSLVCEACGEPVMDTHTRVWQGKNLCIPCWKSVTSSVDVTGSRSAE